MRKKLITLGYKSKPNDDGKTTYIEYVGIMKDWRDKEFLFMSAYKTGFTPFFITMTKKEWREIKNDNQAILKKYTDTMEKLFNDMK